MRPWTLASRCSPLRIGALLPRETWHSGSGVATCSCLRTRTTWWTTATLGVSSRCSNGGIPRSRPALPTTAMASPPRTGGATTSQASHAASRLGTMTSPGAGRIASCGGPSIAARWWRGFVSTNALPRARTRSLRFRCSCGRGPSRMWTRSSTATSCNPSRCQRATMTVGSSTTSWCGRKSCGSSRMVPPCPGRRRLS